MKERTTPTWTLWAVVLLALVGVVPEVSADLDLGVCQSTCSAVPQDLWPYCCETHHTCCEEFADSCIHDCLPRVSSGDVSAVEERPGLCCALYNLCCFRETPRISSIRSQGVQEPQSFPITHRFSTLPGGPGRNRQSSATAPKVPQTAAPAPAPAPATTTFSKPKVNNEVRRPTSINRPKPARNPPTSFRDTPRSETRQDVFDDKNADDNNLGHRFDVRDPTTERPSQFQNSQTEEEDTIAFNRPSTPSRPQKLIKLARPVSASVASEAQNKDTPVIPEPLEARTNTITPKTLDRPRPGSAFRPQNPRQLSNPEPEVPEIPEEETEQEQINPIRPSFLNRSLQQRKLSLTNPSDDPSPPEEEPSQSQPKEERRSSKLLRTGPLIRSGVNRDNSKPVSEVTEQPEQLATVDAETSRGPKLLRPKIKPFRPGKKDTEDSDLSPQADQDQDQVVLDSNLNQQTLKEEAPAFLKSDIATELPEKSTGPKPIRNGSPIRKIKLIRPRENNKNQRPNNQEQAVTEAEPKETQQITEGTTVVPPTTRSQVTSGRSRSAQRVTATTPQGTQGRTGTSTQASQGRSRGRSRFTEESSVDNTQGSARGTSRSTSTQEGSRGGASSARGRTRTRSRPVASEPVKAVESQDPKKTNVLAQESAKLPSLDVENEEMLKEQTETVAEAPVMNDEKMMEGEKEMEKVMHDGVLTLPNNVNNNENIVSTGAPVVPEEKPMHEQEKMALSKKTPDVSELPTEDQKSYLPVKSSLVEEETDSEKMADQLSAIGQSPKLVPSPRQHSEPQASIPITEPELPRVTLQQQIPRVTSQPQEPVQSQVEQQFSRQRSETQTASRQRSTVTTQTATRQSANPSSGQTATRSRGRLTARDRLALSNSAK